MEDGVLGKVKPKWGHVLGFLWKEVRVFIFPLENETQPGIITLRKETHMQRDGAWGSGTSSKGPTGRDFQEGLCSRARPGPRTFQNCTED